MKNENNENEIMKIWKIMKENNEIMKWKMKM